MMADRLDKLIETLPQLYPGPGGACAVLRDGETLVRHSWGWANAERRIPFTPGTLFRMCSITKQFTCGLVLDTFPDPCELDADIRARLPLLEGAVPGALHLCHNQSGLRDYWAVAMLHGAPVESPFGEVEAARLIAATRSLQFVPGTRYAYCNQNFRILSDILEARTGRSFAELLRTRIFHPAGMHTAMLAANTRAMPDGTEGYEGTRAAGFRAAENRILWTGDAGLGATLDDMIAWERHIDSTRDDPASLYQRLSAPVAFSNGAPSAYGFGLGRRREFGRDLTGHGGALRGWRSHRLYVPSERISVVVMFNHLSDAHAAAIDLLAAALNEDRAKPTRLAPPGWLDDYQEPETGLAARIDTTEDGRIRLRYGHAAELLDMRDANTAANDSTTLHWHDGALHMDRPSENQSTVLIPIEGEPAGDIAGTYACSELGTRLTIENAGGALYGAFSGQLGQGRMELLEAIGPNLWALPCPRALDHTPPGDWTLRFELDEMGRIKRLHVGCWLARQLEYAAAGHT